MAAVNPVPDPLDEMIEHLLADPALAADIDVIEAELAGPLLHRQPGSHNEARRIAGLPPLPATDPRL